MGKIILISGILFAVALILFDQAPTEEEIRQLRSIHEESGTQDSGPAESEAVVHATEVSEDEVAEVVFFPRSRIVASVADPEGADGRQRVLETVETSTKNKFVRLERTLQAYAGGGSQVVAEVAMVENQLLLRKPAGMASYMFLDILSRAGALEVKELEGNSYLATFRSKPEDPRALEDYSATVQGLAEVEISIEPNYLGRTF